MKISLKNKEKSSSIKKDDTKDRVKELLQLNQELKEKQLKYNIIFNTFEEKRRELELMERVLEEEKRNYLERYTKLNEKKETIEIEHENISESHNEDISKEFFVKIVSMKEKITKKIEILGISENEVDEREEKINNELKGLTREEFEEFKLFEQEILNSDQDRITEELKKYKLDYSKLEELNIESFIQEFQSTITYIKNSKKSKSMGDIFKLKNLNENQIQEVLFKTPIDNFNIKSENENEKKINMQYEILLSDLKLLEDTAKKNILNHGNELKPINRPVSNEKIVYVKNNNKKSSGLKQTTKKINEVSKLRDNSNKHNRLEISVPPIIKTKTMKKSPNNENNLNHEITKEIDNSDSPIYIRHLKKEDNLHHSNHIQRIRNNQRDKEANSPLITDPNNDHGIVFTAGATPTENTNKTVINESSLFKQGSVIQGVKTNRTFHLLRNKRIQEMMDSNIVVTMDAIGGRHCCERLKRIYDVNLSLSCNRIQNYEMSKLSYSLVSRSGTSFPNKNLSKINSPKISNISSPNESNINNSPKISKQSSRKNRSVSTHKCLKCLNWNHSVGINNKYHITQDHSYGNKNRKLINTTKDHNEEIREKPKLIVVQTNHENLITFKNDVNIFTTDKKQVSNNLSKYVNSQSSNNNSIKVENQNELVFKKQAKIQTTKINSNKREMTESSNRSKKTSKNENNDKFQSKLFNNDQNNELNRSKSSIKSSTTSKNTFELKSKIFNDSNGNKKDNSLLNISPIKKQSSEENVSKAQNNVTINSQFLNNLEASKEKGFIEEDSKFTLNEK